MPDHRYICVQCKNELLRAADEAGEKVSYNRDWKYDILIRDGTWDERRLGDYFAGGKFSTLELKSEQYLWERTGNIAIEYRWSGRPSGIASTIADMWVHELKRKGETLAYIMVPMERLKAICREAYANGRHQTGGDDDLSELVLLKLRDIPW